MFNEHEMIKNLIFWQPPENVKIIWADNLKNILTSTNKTAPKGWLRNLLSPLGSKKGIILSNSEKEMIYHLRTLLQLTSVKGLNWEISMMWGVRAVLYEITPSYQNIVVRQYLSLDVSFSVLYGLPKT
jgi:hypothetical protein